jgi:hypothetical protein
VSGKGLDGEEFNTKKQIIHQRKSGIFPKDDSVDVWAPKLLLGLKRLSSMARNTEYYVSIQHI